VKTTLNKIRKHNPCASDEIFKQALAAQPAAQEPVAWVPFLSDRSDGVQGHYAIARWNPRGYREVWNLRRHAWGAFSDDVMSLEEADYLLQQITIPTRKPTPPAASAQSCYCERCEALAKELAALKAQPAPVQSCYCPNCEALGKEIAALKAQPAPPTADEYNQKLRQQLENEWAGLAEIRKAEQPAVPLTDEQIETIRQQPQHHKGEFDYKFDERSFARAIEAAHGITEKGQP